MSKPQRRRDKAIEAERAILGCVLLRPELWADAEGAIEAGDFWRDNHRATFEWIRDRHAAGKPADLVAISCDADCEPFGGAAYVSQHPEIAVSTEALPHYIDTVRKQATRERIIHAAGAIKAAVDDHDDPGEALALAERRLQVLAGSSAPQDFVSAHDIMSEQWKAYGDRAESRVQGACAGLSTGYPDLDKITGGLRPTELIILAARPAMGKAQPLDAKVKTLDGWVAMGDIEAGDDVASVDGKPSVVSGVFPQGERQVYRVTFSDGRSTECCDEHLWRVNSRDWPEPRTLPTGKVRDLLRAKRNRKRLWIDLPSGDFGAVADLPIDPWVLGVLIGDGCFTGNTVKFSGSDKEILDRLGERLPAHELHQHSKYDYSIVTKPGTRGNGRGGYGQNSLRAALSSLGLWGKYSYEKSIPPEYLHASKQQRLEMLRGLMDTDGWAEKYGTPRYCTTSKALCDGIVSLVRSLGGICAVSEKRPFYTHNGERREGRKAYIIGIRHPDPKSLFLLPRKRDAARPAPRTPRLSFVTIEATRTTETQCIAVTHPGHLYITDDHIVTHNTALGLNIARNIVKGGIGVAFCSQEMSRGQCLDRMMAAEVKVSAEDIRDGIHRDQREDWDRIIDGVEILNRWPLWVSDTAGMKVSSLASKARRLKAANPHLGLLIVDYLQIMGAEDRKNNRETQVAEIATGLKRIAMELKIPVVAVAQLNRGVEARSNKRPNMSDLRESGQIEQDADIIAFLYRDEYYDGDSKSKGLAEVNIEKNRNGRTGQAQLTWAPVWQRFDSLERYH
jgi:replicative DNA helicase